MPANLSQLDNKFSPILLFILAILPRLAAIGRYVTPDEPAWVLRSIRFRQAVLSTDWANTLQSGHPGVTTTWLGSLGIQIKLWLQPGSRLHLDWLHKLYWLSPENGEAFKHLYYFLQPSRIIVILVNCLGLVIIYLLARRRLGRFAALVAGFLLALDPFLSGLSGLLHLDASLATFMVMTILLLLPETEEGEAQQLTARGRVDRRYWFFAGITTALAILTKSPGLILLVIVPALWVWQFIRQREPVSFHLQQFGLWLASTILVVLLLFPAIWADPGNTFEMVRGLAERLLVDSVRPVFFLGQSTVQPGSTFYPLALIFRLSPLVTLALLGALALLILRLIKRRTIEPLPNLMWLLIFGVTFAFFLNFSAKRFDRYLLPTIYAFILVTGWGLAYILDLIFRRGYMIWSAVTLLFCAGLVVAYLTTAWPYPITAFNWLAGGPSVAYKLLPVDWGEGSSNAARLAAAMSNAADQTLFATNLPGTAPFFPGAVRPLDQLASFGAKPGDFLLYQATDWQADPGSYPTNNKDLPIPEEMAGWPVVAAPRSNGLTRAVLLAVPAQGYASPSPVSVERLDLSFDHNLSLGSATVLPTTSPTQFLISSTWQLYQPGDFQIVIELQDSRTFTWVGQEFPLLNEVDHPARFWLPGETQVVLHEFDLPVDLAPGRYTFHLSLFDSAGSRLGVFDDTGLFRGVTAEIGSIDIQPLAEQPAVPVPVALDSGTELVGIDKLPDTAGSGELLTLDLWWQVKEAETSGHQLALLLQDTVIVPEGGLPDGLVGQTYHIKSSWRLPLALEARVSSVSLQLIGENGQELWEEPVDLGFIEIVHRDRIFELPSGLEPLQVVMGQLAHLQQANAYSKDGQLMVELIWQALQPDDHEFTAFVHLINQDGEIIAQVDRPPMVPTDQWVPGQVIGDQFLLSSPGEGPYTLATGFYNPNTGQRVPVFDRIGRHYTDDSYRMDLQIP